MKCFPRRAGLVVVLLLGAGSGAGVRPLAATAALAWNTASWRLVGFDRGPPLPLLRPGAGR